MTLEAIRCFCALVETGSFSLAADRVHRTQPAVTQQIRKLEGEVGASLFDRKRGRPTRAGSALYERGRRMLQAADEAMQVARDIGEANVEPIRLGTSDTVAIYRLPDVIKKFGAAMPGVSVTVVNRPSSTITEHVADGRLDVGIVAMPVATPELEIKQLFDQRLVLAVPANHALAARSRVSLTKLSDEPMLLLSDETRTGGMLRRHFEREGFTPKVVLDTVSHEVVKAHIAAGNGIGFLPEETLGDGIVGVRVPKIPSIAIGALWRRGVARARGVEVFVDLLAGG